MKIGRNFSHGFSLLEILFATSLLVTISGFMFTTMKNLQTSQKQVEDRAEAMMITMNMNSLLLDMNVVDATFKGLDSANPALLCILDKSYNAVYFKGQKIGKQFIESFTVTADAPSGEVINIKVTPNIRAFKNTDTAVASMTCLACKQTNDATLCQ